MDLERSNRGEVARGPTRKRSVVACLLIGIAMPWVATRTTYQDLHDFYGKSVERLSGDMCFDGGNCSSVQQRAVTRQATLPEHTVLMAKLNHIVADYNQSIRVMPPHTPGAFIHLGKCGGSSLSVHLRNGCHSFVRKPCRPKVANESYISKLTTYVHTPDFDKLGRSDWTFDFYAVTIRDPLQRFMSAFAYMHPENRLTALQQRRAAQPVFECFPTLESFSKHIGDDFKNHQDYNSTSPSEVDSSNCTLLARALLVNRVRPAQHFYYDTKYIQSKLPVDKPVLVLRNEFLWRDWVTANQWLGDKEVAIFPDDHIRDFSNKTLRVNKTLSEVGRRRLCLALEQEYRAYWNIIARAVNFFPEEKEASTVLLSKQSCPELRPPSY